MTNFRVVAAIVLNVMFYSLAFWWSYNVACIYYSYPTNAEIAIIRRKNISLPAFAFCSPPNFKYNLPLEYDPQDYGKNIMKNGSAIPSLNMKQQLEASSNETDFFAECTLRLPNMTSVPCSRVTHITSYIMPEQKCFALFEEAQLKVSSDQLIYSIDKLNGVKLLKVKANVINPEFVEPLMTINVYSNNEIPRPQRGNVAFAIFTSDVYKSVSLTYTKATFYHLPYPYNSLCIDYKQTLFKSRVETIERCVLSECLKKSKVWPQDVLYYSDLRDGDVLPGPHLIFKINAARVICNKRHFQPECELFSYKLITKSTQHREEVPTDTDIPFAVTIYGPTTSETVVKETNRLTWIDLFANIGSVMSLCVGLSVFSLLDGILSLLMKAMRSGRAVTLNSLPHNTRGSKTEKFLKVVLYIICIFGGLMNVSQAIYMYIEDPFVTDISLYHPKTTQVPSMTLCFEINNVTVEERCPKEYEDAVNVSWTDELSIDQLFNFTVAKSELFEVFGVLLPTLNHTTFRDEYPAEIQMNKMFKCFTFFSDSFFPNSSKPYLNVLDIQGLYSAGFHIHSSLEVKQIQVLFHPHKLHASDNPGDVELKFDHSEHEGLKIDTYRLSSGKMTRTMIPFHRKSKCRDYSKQFSSESRADAVDKCILRTFIAKHGAVPHNMFVSEKQVPLKFKFIQNTTSLRETTKKCKKLYPWPDCVQVMYSMEIKEAVHMSFPTCSAVIDIEASGGAELLIEDKLRFSLIELITYVAGLMSVWLGLSLVDVSILLSLPLQLIWRNVKPLGANDVEMTEVQYISILPDPL